MGLRGPLLLGSILLGAVPSSLPGAEPGGSPGAKPQAASFEKQIVPLLKKHCLSCHSGAKAKAELRLDRYADETAILKDRKVWEKVLKNVRTREMPPKGASRPTEAEIDLLTGWVDGVLARVDCQKSDPGRVTIRRLNRAEYNNTIRDLVGVNFQPGEGFPADDVGYGFDNIGDVLSLPPLLMEKYLAAAEKIVTEAFKSPELKKRILVVQPDEKNKAEASRQILESFATRAYRRPVGRDELQRILRFVELAERNGDGFETGLKLALQAILVSPHFLFKVEIDKEPTNPDAVNPITSFELATRLSYFLWSSMPDEELFNHAKQGTLRPNLEAQVKRMLLDPKAKALVENFAGQWLTIRNLASATPDPKLFPTFDEDLRRAMLKETELFFEAIIREDRSVLDFIDADFTFLNERLAKHYGVGGIKGDEFRRVALKGRARGGILTHASVLTVTSNPTRTSPVKRGKWILENILGTPPPPPPPDVDELSESKEAELKGSLRQRMEQHRAKPNCAVCHQRMDPLGFGFENFDAVGAWRTKDGKFAIDPSGTLPGGETFKGPAELKAILKKRKDDFSRCLAEKMLTYALGRGLEYYDKCAVDQATAALAKNDYKFSTLVLEIVKSDPFQKRRGKRE